MPAIPTLKISISGVRGVVGDSLTPALLARFAQAFGTYVGSGRIIIGRDTRSSGEMVRHAVVSGLLSSGCRIVDLGVCPVPTVQLMVRQTNAHGGVAITASHNPPEWNALKFVGPDGLFLPAARGRELLDIYHQGEYTRARGVDMRPVQHVPRALDAHVAAILSALGPLPPRRPPLRVALDSCNGAGSIITPRLLSALGVEVVPINVTPDGSFPRPAEPLPENLEALCKAVVAGGADVGFAQDMDADRLAIVSERGEPIGEDRTLVLAVEQVLSAESGPVVTNIATSHAVDEVAFAHGCPVFRTRVGEANVTEKMKRSGAVIGGEGNGGVIYPRVNFARDSLVGMTLVLHLLARDGRPLSGIVASLPRSELLKAQMHCPSHRITEVLRRVRREHPPEYVNLLDGVKVALSEGRQGRGAPWFLVRGSNTEPVLRLVAEAPTADEARQILDALAARIRGWLSEAAGVTGVAPAAPRGDDEEMKSPATRS